MYDGSRLRQSWYDALNNAESHFRRLLSSPPSEWKRVSSTSDTSSSRKGKLRMSAIPDPAEVMIHRRSSRSGDDVYRIVVDVAATEENELLDPWRAVLAIPELRQDWDPSVETAHQVEVFDHSTQICKTNYTLGWPSNPRDAVTISRSYHDPSTIIDISTSLPRSPDEPAYLRPSPPYVRSNVALFAWCIQYFSSQPPKMPENPSRKNSLGSRIRVTCFWQHDLKTAWNFGSSSGFNQQLATMAVGLVKTVKKRGSRLPTLSGYGNGISIERVRFQIDRQSLTVEYTVVPEDDAQSPSLSGTMQGLDELHAAREHKRLTRAVEYTLPSSEGWDVQLSTKASSHRVEQLPWTAEATRLNSSALSPNEPDQIVLKINHSPLLDDHSILKVKMVIEISGPSNGIRLNGLTKAIQEVEALDPSSHVMSQQILQDVSTTADISFRTASSRNTINSIASSTSSSPGLIRPPTERPAAAEKSILSRVRRNYIYFSSLLQEPEAKWKRTTEARGVSITQLDSIDPTLVVYRAEATFVGIGLWDLYGTIVSPGAKIYWDKQHEDAVLLEDVNELTELWHIKTKPAWPVNGRDSVVLKTVYKSPKTIHVFSFSADDAHLFSNIPPVEANVIRTQVDLQGWAIEALSPTTTLLTLLEQSDPKGWTNKTSIPQQMINSLAGIGEFAIKCGGPPVVTRLSGAKANQLRYDHERGLFKIEYEGSAARKSSTNADSNGLSSILPVIECELRCDIDTWASSLDIVVDPPPQSMTCLRRHRLSAEGGGLWLTLTHDAVFVDDERLLTIVRRGPGKEKGVVMVNGTRVNVDVEDLPEHEIKTLTKKKRVKPPRIPLDQPPVMGAIRRRRAEWDADTDTAETPDISTSSATNTLSWPSAPRFSSPLSRLFTVAVESATTTTQQAVAAIAPATSSGNNIVPSSSKAPMQYALEALAWTCTSHSRFKSEGWSSVSDKGLPVHRILASEISPVIPVHKGEKVIEGVSAEEVASVVHGLDFRKKWDDRFDSMVKFESFGAECHTAFLVSKGGFPFRDRGFYLASVMVRAQAAPALSRRAPGNGESEQSNGRNAIFCVSASFSPDSVASFSPTKYNPYGLPIGRMFVDAWILETLDPYTTEKYAIPSARCTRVVAVDYGGSIPAAVNSVINATLPKSILAVEAYIKATSPLPITRLPAAGLIISDKQADDSPTNTTWKLRRRDENRLLISTEYRPDERIYHSTLVLKMPLSTATSSFLSPRPGSPRSIRLSSNSQTPASPETTPTLGNEAITPTYGSLSDRRRRTSSTSNQAALRSSSSAFTIKGELRPSADLLVAEIVVDSKLYPDGYDVQLRSRLRGSAEHIPLRSIANDGRDSQTNRVLPLAFTVHTMPSSPLHSSGLNADRPTRHLIRLTLPTAQYQISTVQDPLTGETQSAPTKPQWLIDLEEKDAVIDVVVRAAPAGAKRGEKLVEFDGTAVTVANEKLSLTILGRDELQDDRISKMAVLSRIQSEGEALSLDLRVPLAIDDTLLDPSLARLKAAGEVANEPEEVSAPQASTEEPAQSEKIEPPSVTHVQRTASSGLFGFLHGYPNPLARFTPSAPSTSATASLSRRHSATIAAQKPPGGLQDGDGVAMPGFTRATFSTPLYPFSTIIITGLIAFLIGSLLRSLLSPADFIYVVTDLKEAEEANSGWREIKRLLEVKYILGGWDFQIAVVRRH